MAFSTSSSATSSPLLNWSGVLVLLLVCLPLASCSVTSQLGYGVVFSRRATASLNTKYYLRNLTLPLPAESDFYQRPFPCSNKSEPGPDCPLDALMSNIVQHVRAESDFHLFDEIRKTLEELDTVVGDPPRYLYEGYKNFSDLQSMNWTNEEIKRHKAENQRTVDDHWNATLSGSIPVGQLSALSQIAWLQALEARLEWYDYERGLRQVLQGRLHPAVVPENFLDQQLYKVYRGESQENIYFDLGDLDTPNYYRQNRVKAVTVDGGRLIVTLAIPFDTYDNRLYDLYEVRTFPVLTKAGDVILSSRLEGVPRYLVVAKDLHTFAETDKWDDSVCEGPEDSRTCLLSLASMPSKDPSCLLAVFLNDTGAAKTKCSFHMRRETSVPPSTMVVSPGLVLWTNASNITAVCQDLPGPVQVLSGCLQCVIPASCSCILQTEHLLLPPAPSPCQKGAVSPLPMPDSRAVLFRMPSEQPPASLDADKLQDGKLPMYARALGEEDVDSLLSQNRLGPFPMRVAEIKAFVESLAVPEGQSEAGYQTLLHVGLTLAVMVCVALACLTAWLKWLEKKMASLKQRCREQEENRLLAAVTTA